MNRREALLGMAAGFASVAGCAGTSDVGSPPDGTEPKTDTETEWSETSTQTSTATTAPTPGVEPERSKTTARTADSSIDYPGLLVRSQHDQAQAVLVLGNRSNPRSPYREAKPHEMLVWNDANTTRTIGVEFADRREQYDLKPDGYLRVQVAKPGKMNVSILDGNNTTAETIRIRSDLVDCNDSQTDVAVRENGAMETKSISTMEGCATVTANGPTRNDSSR